VSEENVLHALVSLKSRTIKSGMVKLPRHRPVVNDEVDIPFADGDSMTLVLTMAIAEAEGGGLLELPAGNTMRKVYEFLQGRLCNLELDRIGIRGP
jgi:hypothetical protein